MSPRTLLVIGGGLMQVPVVQAAKRMGLSVAVMDRLPDAAAMALADEKVLADISDVPAAVEAAKAVHSRRPLSGSITAGTDFPVTSAAIAKALGLPGLPIEVAEKAKDKIRMREAFAAGGCPQPDFHPVLDAAEAKRLSTKLIWPQVVKPADSMGARGVRRVDGAEEFLVAADEARAFSKTGRVIVEDYVGADELSLDALVWDDEIFIRGIADRIIENEPFFIETGHVLPSDLPGERIRAACAAFASGIRALGIRRGAAKGDIRVNERGAFLGEIAARLSGGFMSGYTTPYATGVDLLSGAIRIALGEAPGPLEPSRFEVSVERAILGRPGTVRSVHGVEKARSLPGVKQIFLNWKPGDVIRPPRNNVEKGGNVIVTGADRREAFARAEAALAAIRIELEPA